MTTRTTTTAGDVDRPALPAGRAFVLHLHADCDPRREGLRGRIEHVQSGQAAHFASVAELLAFCGRITEAETG